MPQTHSLKVILNMTLGCSILQKKKIELRQSKSNKNAAVTRPFVVSGMKKDGCAKRFIVDQQGGDSPLI